MDAEEKGKARIGTGYATFQLAQVLISAERGESHIKRENALKRVAKWTAVVLGTLAGRLEPGSRTPVQGTPAWATPEVVTGGFATGVLLAGGPLRAHEMTSSVGGDAADVAEVRLALNREFLTDTGISKLGNWLSSGQYEIDVPEEGALLVVAWLALNGHAERARALVDELAEYFPALRFYPAPSGQQRRFGRRVCLEDVATTIARLRAIGTNPRLLAQKEAVEVWRPLYDRIIGLFLETVSGEPPCALRTVDGKWVRADDGKFSIQGGWPCAKYPSSWLSRAQDLLDQFARDRATHKFCARPENINDSFGLMLEYLRRVAISPADLSGRDVGRIRLILARYVARHGLPNSRNLQALRSRQKQDVAALPFHEIAKVVIRRLEVHSSAPGLDDISDIIQPMTDGQRQDGLSHKPISIPPSIKHKVERCLQDSLNALVERRAITSGEVLARLLPQLTSGIRAQGIADPALRELYAAIYRAFRRRRSLLLMDLQRQVQIEELPWIAAIDRFRSNDQSVKTFAKQTLVEVASLTISSFPHVVVPNKLLQEFRTLATAAELPLYLVEEVAADIFMGRFSPKFSLSAKIAAKVLDGTLYARYFGIDYEQVRGLPEQSTEESARQSARDEFAELCAERAGVTLGGWDAAVNGMIIEQQQILTSQNLAVLFDSLGLANALEGRLEGLAKQCFKWVCKRLQMRAEWHHAKLIQIKNAAYAWRQMVFYLALLSSAEIRCFVAWAREDLEKQPAEFQGRFVMALSGLESAALGQTLQISGATPAERPFLGWTTQDHWLIPGKGVQG